MNDLAAAIAATPPLHYAVRGRRIVIDVPDAEARAQIRAILAGFPYASTVPTADTTRYTVLRDADMMWSIAANGTAMHQAPALHEALAMLEWQIVSEVLAGCEDVVHLHGASLLTPSRDACILILGESGSGKTTLTLGLMSQGFLPYADDVSLIEPTTLLPRSFRRAFHTDAYTLAILRQLDPGADYDFDAAPRGYFVPRQWADTAVPVRFIFFPTLRPSIPPHLTPLPLSDAVATLLPFSATLGWFPSLAMATTARLCAGARCFTLSTGDLAQTVALVQDIVASARG